MASLWIQKFQFSLTTFLVPLSRAAKLGSKANDKILEHDLFSLVKLEPFSSMTICEVSAPRPSLGYLDKSDSRAKAEGRGADDPDDPAEGGAEVG